MRYRRIVSGPWISNEKFPGLAYCLGGRSIAGLREVEEAPLPSAYDLVERETQYCTPPACGASRAARAKAVLGHPEPPR